MSDATPNMVWTKEAERNLILCLWFADTAPDRKIETSKWAKITQDFCRIQGRRVNTTALQTRVNLLKNSFFAVSNQTSPATNSGNARPEEKSHKQVPSGAAATLRTKNESARPEEKGKKQVPVGTGNAPRANSGNARLEKKEYSQSPAGIGGPPRARSTEDQTEMSLYRPSLYPPGLYIPGPYHVSPEQYNQPHMAHGDYTYAHPGTHHGAMSPGGMGHGEIPSCEHCLRGDVGEDTESPKHTYLAPK